MCRLKGHSALTFPTGQLLVVFSQVSSSFAAGSTRRGSGICCFANTAAAYPNLSLSLSSSLSTFLSLSLSLSLSPSFSLSLIVECLPRSQPAVRAEAFPTGQLLTLFSHLFPSVAAGSTRRGRGRGAPTPARAACCSALSPRSRSPKPETRNPKSETQNPRPET